MIVVDVGCMTFGGDESVRMLTKRFAPDVLFGFDPHSQLDEGIELVDSTVVIRRRLAAWTTDGVIPYVEDGLRSGYERDGREVPCFDLAAFLRTLPEGFVLKLDCEGCEYPLLAAFVNAGQDLRASLVLVEWHDTERAHGLERRFRPALSCSVEEW